MDQGVYRDDVVLRERLSALGLRESVGTQPVLVIDVWRGDFA